MAIINPDDVPIPTRNNTYAVPGATLAGIADAIRLKTGGHDGIQVANMASEILAIPTGGGGSGEPSVIFIDYDGTVVEEWTADQLVSKTTLPNNPSHDRLVAQGWNWNLADIKSYITDYPEAVVTVGQMYDTASGLTEFDITVTKVTGLTVTCKMVGNKTWGDGTSDSATEHTYAAYGDYTITCDGTAMPAGSSTSGGVFGSSTSNINRYWCTCARISSRVTSTRIGAYAFSNCYSLTSVTIPNGVTSINNYTFSNCYSLTSVTIPNGVTSINNYAFQYCCSLTSVAIPNSVTSINSYTFQYCYSLTSIVIPSRVTSISAYAFGSCYLLTSVVIPSRVTSISGSAFGSCYSLTSVVIPRRATSTSIGSNVFSNCYSLTSVAIPNGVTSIGSSAFSNCRSLTGVTISNGVTSISTSAFSTCYSCIEYNFTDSTQVPTLGNVNAFTSISGICKILVPAALYDEWIAATNWATYADYIYPV